MVAGMEECSYSEFSAGPLGLFTTERHKTKNTIDTDEIWNQGEQKHNFNFKDDDPLFPLQSMVSTKSQ